MNDEKSMNDIYNEFKNAYKMKWEELEFSKEDAFDVWQKKRRELEKYFLELLLKDSRGFEHCVREIVKSCNVNKDEGVLETIIDILELKRNVVPFEDIMDIYHDLLFEKWHCFYDRIIDELQINKNSASVNYLYKALHMNCEFMIESPTVRGNCVYAIWSFETEEAEHIKKLLFEDFLYDVRYAAMQIKENADGVSYELEKFVDFCLAKNIKYFYGIEPRKDYKIFEFYDVCKNKLFYDGLKEPKILVKDLSEYNWLEKFLKGKNIYISIVHIKEYIRITNGEDIIKILTSYNFNTIFITDDEVTFYITIKKGKEIILQGNAVNWYA